jgi:O-glycosyl hydrolase
MNRKIFFAVGSIVLCAVLFIVGCELSVNDPVRAIPIIKPYISTQPQSYSYFVNDFPGAPTLSVNLIDWNNADGNITYQWYTFDSIEEYCTPPIGGRAISGATQPTFTPSGIIPEDGKRYYYYARVTNNFIDATDQTTATIQSELAIISFAAADKTPFPVMSLQPVDAAYTIGRAASITPLEVQAGPPGDWLADLSSDTGTNPMWMSRGIKDSGGILQGAWSVPVQISMERGIGGEYTDYRFAISTADDTNEFGDTPEYSPNGNNPGTSWSDTPPAMGTRNFLWMTFANWNGATRITSWTEPERISGPSADGNSHQAIYQRSLERPATPTLNNPLRSNGTVSYQWYSNTSFSITGGTAITGATQPIFAPDMNNLKRGENYFYVEVSNTIRVGSGTNVVTLPPQTQTLLPVIITMLPGVKAEMPRIEQQPKDQIAFSAGEVKDLSIMAIPVDGGTLSYQWYKMDKAATTFTGTGASRDYSYPVVLETIAGATGPTLEKTLLVTSGKAYYRVIVTNTNNDVTGEKTATTESKIVTIAVGTGTVPMPNVFVDIPDPTNAASRRQYIRGFGGMDVAWLNFPGQYEEDTEMMHNPDWGLGFNIMRIMIMPPGSNDGNYVDQEKIITKLLNSGSFADNNYKGDYINNVKVVNKYGGYVLASPWTPPKEWKTNNSVNSGGYLIPAYYKNFATYLRSFCQYMYYQGAPVYAVSIANEPNYIGGYDGCEWSSEQMRDFWKEVGHFTDGVRGYGGGKSIPSVLTMNGESANTPRINDATLNDPVSRAAVDLYARHVYGSQEEQLWDTYRGSPPGNQYASYQEGSPYQTECWMTEHNINSATASSYPNDYTWNYIWRFMNDVDLVIRHNNENAFVWWANKRFYSYIGDGVAGNMRGAVLPRGYGLSHFAKYTIDKTRLHFENRHFRGTLPNGAAFVGDRTDTQGGNVNKRWDKLFMNNVDAKITAYVSQDGNEISMVMYTPTLVDGTGGVDLGWVKITMPAGFTIGSAQAVRSTGQPDGKLMQKVMEPEDVIIDPLRDAAYVELPRSNLLSLRFTRE